MDGYKDFTFDHQKFGALPNFAQQIHADNRKLILILDPAIASKPSGSYPPLELGLEMEIFLKDPITGDPVQGVVWPGPTFFPDFTNPKSLDYWSQLIADFHKEVEFDGLWIDMNEPSNFVYGSTQGCAKNHFTSPPFCRKFFAKIPTEYKINVGQHKIQVQELSF